MALKDIVINSFGRPRSGWRFLIFFLLYFLFTIPTVLIFNLVLSRLPIGYGPDSLMSPSLNFAISLFWAITLGWLCGRTFEGLPFRALGVAFTSGWLRDLILGLVLGAVPIILVAIAAMAFGGLGFRFNTNHGTSAILLTLAVSGVVFVIGAAFEEALCRGYILQTFVRAGWAWPAIILTSLLFASGHLQNPSINPIAFVNTFLAGIWFCVAYMKTRTLWLPFGMHFMWNWVQGSVLGIEVSGLTNISTAPVLLEIDHGPAWLTGAEYGIEGSVTCSVVIVLATIAIYFSPFLKPTDDMFDLTSRERPVEYSTPSGS